MSHFTVELVNLDAVIPHPDADRLEIAQIGGYNAVVQKGQFHSGDMALYIPEDAIVPEYVLDAIGLTGKLAGSKHNRVKAIRLRGVLSQGIVVDAATVLGLIQKDIARYEEMYPGDVLRGGQWLEFPFPTIRAGQDLGEFLCITKYEEPIPVQMQGVARPRPAWFPKYTEIENIKKYNRILIEGEDVIITEKTHGSNMGAGMHRDDQQMLVSSRNFVLDRDEKNVYWRAAEQHGLDDHLLSILEHTGADSAVIYGEVYGPSIQDLTYGVEPGTLGFAAFDIMLDGEFVDRDLFFDLVGPIADWDEDGYIVRFDIPIVPVLYSGPWHDGLIEEFTSGVTTIPGADHIREGFVVKPAVERRAGTLGRVILKSISPDYLLRKNGSERH